MASNEPIPLNPSKTIGAVYVDAYTPVQLYERPYYEAYTLVRKRGPGVSLPKDEDSEELEESVLDEVHADNENAGAELPSLSEDEDELPSLDEEDELPSLEEKPEEPVNPWPMLYTSEDPSNDPEVARLLASGGYTEFLAGSFGPWREYKYKYPGGLRQALKTVIDYEVVRPLMIISPSEIPLLEDTLDRIEALRIYLDEELTKQFPGAFGDEDTRRRLQSQAWMRSKDAAKSRRMAKQTKSSEEELGAGLRTRGTKKSKK